MARGTRHRGPHRADRLRDDPRPAGRGQPADVQRWLDHGLPDPEDILDLKFYSGSALNDVNYNNAEVDAILEEARVEQDAGRRLELYQEAERLIIEDAAWLPLYFSQAHVVINADIEGWFEPPMVIPRLRFVQVNR